MLGCCLPSTHENDARFRAPAFYVVVSAAGLCAGLATGRRERPAYRVTGTLVRHIIMAEPVALPRLALLIRYGLLMRVGRCLNLGTCEDGDNL